MKALFSAALLFTPGITSVTAAVTDDLVAYWTFDGAGANHAAASGGAAYNGILMGDAAVTGTPKVGSGALSLDGNGDYMDVTSIVDVNQPWTVSAWFRSSVAPTNRGFVYESVQSTTAGYAMSYGIREGSPATHTGFQLYTDNTPGADLNSSVQIPDAETVNTWHHIITAFTPATASTSGSIIGYLDGVQQYNLLIPAGDTMVPANGFHIGTYRSADDRWFNGSIDEVAIWNRTLTLEEALEVHSRGDIGEPLTAPLYSVILTSNPAGRGTTSGTGAYNPGEQVAISAIANPGYTFLAWTGDFSGQPSSFTYTAEANANSSVTFGEDTADTDGDGLSNYQEIIVFGTLPDNPDTDGDRIPDGAEVFTTNTNPAISDSTLVNMVEQNLSGGSFAGAITLLTPRISRDPGDGIVRLFLGLSGSADQQVWLPVNLNGPEVSITPAGNHWDITIPAPSNTVNSYLLLGR